MKRFIFLFLVLKVISIVTFSQSFIVKLSDNTDSFYALPTYDSITINLKVSQLELQIDNSFQDTYINILAQNFFPTQNIAQPKLIQFNSIFEIPNGKKPIIKIINQKWIKIDLSLYSSSKIIPAQPSIIKTNPDLTFHKDIKTYSTDKFYGFDIISIENIGKLRSHSLAKLIVSPLKYNPVSNVLNVCTEIDFVIEFIDCDSFSFSDFEKDNFLKSHFFDFINDLSLNSKILNNDKSYFYNLPVSYLIITDSVFKNTLTPFVNLKTKQGFKVETAFINSPQLGNTPSSIKQFIESKFDTANVFYTAPTFVLLVGDHQLIPSGEGSTGNHPTDWYYAHLSPDYLPDLLVGRFSASDTNELQAIINKTIKYQSFQFANPSYLSNSLLVSGTDVNFSALQGNSHLIYVAQNYLNSQNANNSNLILYPQSIGATNLMTQLFSDGMGIVNYTGHGTPSGWSSPSLNLSNLQNIQNSDKPSVVIANACLTAKFDNQTCIGEALHLKANSGAVAYIGASNNTYWDEDYWWSIGHKPVNNNPAYLPNSLGMWDRWFHLNNETPDNWYVTIAQMIVAGNLAVEMSNSNFRNYYWEVYHAFGDPSLTPYQRTPNQLVASHQPFLLVGSNQLVVNTEPYAMVGFSKENQLIASAFADVNGLAILNFEPLINPGIAKIYVSKQNSIPYSNDILISFTLDANVVNLNFDFVEMSNNLNGVVDYSELLSFDFSAKNFGLDTAKNVYAMLTSLSPYLNLIIDTVGLGSFYVGETKVFNQKFLLQVADNVPNNYETLLNLKIYSNLNIWESIIPLKVNSPVYQISNYSFIDTVIGNNNLWFEPGETVNAIFEVFNNSNSNGKNISVNLSSSSSNLVIHQNPIAIDSLIANQKFETEILMTLNQQTNFGDFISIYFEISDGIYAFQDTVSFIAGVLIEDFETNGFTKFPWFNGYNSESFPWEISYNQVYQGNFSASSGNITHNQFSELAVVIDVFEADSLTFYYKTSCENPGMNTYWDYLSFEINNMVQQKWAGESNWEEAKFLLPQGVHTISWKYVKDNSISSFQDKVWIDNIVFPRKSRLLNTTSIINEPTDDFSLIIYPNPARDEIFIVINNVVGRYLTVEISDTYGRLILNTKIENFSQDKLFKKLDISALKKGVYFVTLYFNSQKITKKIIVL